MKCGVVLFKMSPKMRMKRLYMVHGYACGGLIHEHYGKFNTSCEAEIYGLKIQILFLKLRPPLCTDDESAVIPTECIISFHDENSFLRHPTKLQFCNHYINSLTSNPMVRLF